jgi:putative membrane protein
LWKSSGPHGCRAKSLARNYAIIKRVVKETGMYPGYCWWGGMWIFPVFMMIIMLIVVYLIFVKGGFRPPWRGSERYYGEKNDNETSLDILKKRYAKGEISKEEFEQIKKDILS